MFYSSLQKHTFFGEQRFCKHPPAASDLRKAVSMASDIEFGTAGSPAVLWNMFGDAEKVGFPRGSKPEK